MASTTEACWGRGDEIEELLAPILDREQRSAVLLYGDSGIGKSTVLREVRKRVTIPGIAAGFYEASQAEIDPLLRALDDLLKQIYTVEGAAKQIRIACEKAKSFRSLTSLKDFLLAVLKAMGDSGGLGAFAKGVTGFFGWAADKVSSLDAAIPASLLPKLGADAFFDIMQLLGTALPEEQFVFIVDNLSAPAEAVTAEIRGFSALDTIQTFLSQGFAQAKNLHFVFSWKLNERTQKAFRALSGTLREYGGAIRQLQPIRQTEDIEKWLGSEFPWFSALGESEKKAVAGMVGGLPEIVVRWQESAMEHYDPKVLQKISDDTRKRRFQLLREALEAAAPDDMRVIYGLALTLHAMPVAALAAMVERQPQECLNVLRLWEQRNLLKSRTSDGQALPVFEFQHEHKKTVALECLPTIFADGGEELHDQAYEFFLAYFSMASFRPPTAENLNSALYLFDAFELLSRNRFSIGEAESRGILEAAVQMMLIGGKPDPVEASLKPLSSDWPFAFRGWFLDLCLATSAGFEESLMKGLDEWLASPQSAQTVGLAFAEASAAANLTGRMRGRNRADLVERLLQRQLLLRKKFPKSALLARETGMALANAIAIYSDSTPAPPVENLLAELRDIQSQFALRVDVARTRTTGIVNAMRLYLRAGQAIQIERALADLRMVGDSFQGEAPLIEDQARGLSIAASFYQCSGSRDKLQALLKDLRELHMGSPDRSAVGIQLGGAIVSAITLSETGEEADALLAELRAICISLPQAIASSLLAIGIGNFAGLLLDARDVAAAKRFLNELRLLHAGQPELTAIGEVYADVATGFISMLAALSKMDEVVPTLDELRRLEAEMPGGPFQQYLAKGIGNAIGGYAQLKQTAEARELLEEAQVMQKAAPTDVEVAVHVLRSLGNFIYLQTDAQDVMALTEELVALQQAYPAHSGVAQVTMTGLANAVGVLAGLNRVKDAESLLHESRRMLVAFPADVKVETRHAEVVANAIAGYASLEDETGTGAVPEVNALLAEVKALNPRADDVYLQVERARGISKAGIAYFNRQEMDKLDEVLRILRRTSEGWPGSREIAEQLAWAIYMGLMATLNSGDDKAGSTLKRELIELESRFPGLNMGDPPAGRVKRFDGASKSIEIASQPWMS